ncbi:MAG: winged helix-turn-helix domain-containing protein [Rhodocyclales bacterium]|nr:winged helix-turn-helix domain-containing protein [Rhodocyclales bacterium]
MMPTIRVDDDVYKGLQLIGEPFVDTPNTVIRRLLIEAGVLSDSAQPAPNEAPPAAGGSVPELQGELTPQPVYEVFLLYVLATKLRGRAHKHEATKATLELMSARGFITEADQKVVSTGETRAVNTIAWGRNALKERGLISKNSPRGIWELTEKGMSEGLRVQLPSAK